MSAHPPARIETERLVLRPLAPEEAELLHDAIVVSLEALKRWMPWAVGEPKPLGLTRRYIEESASAFEAGEDFTYVILSADETEVVGSTGLHPRCGAGCLEIGYWVRSDRAGRGYATEATRALTRVGLALEGVERVIIECDPANLASRRIPERLGYTLVEHRVDDVTGPDGAWRDTLRFEMLDARGLVPPT